MLRTSEQCNEIFAALAAAQGDMPTIEKSKEGKIKGESKSGKQYEYSYKYADIADVLESALPILSKNGLAVIQPTMVSNGAIFIITRVCHSSGQWVESEYPVATINGDHQKMGGAMTYARRYALCSLLGIAADEDTDGVGAEDLPKQAPTRTQVSSGKRQAPPEPTEAERKTATVMIDTIRMAETEADLADWLTDNKTVLESLPDSLRDQVRQAYRRTLAGLRDKMPEAAE
jgi:hypothetical protein